ncbi:MAG: alpha-hydroxy acid oxidase [Nocardioidaceae bacterium]
MGPGDIRELLRFRTPARTRTARRLQRCVTIEDLRREASRRWPRGVRGYVDGGADGEVSLDRNTAAFQNFDLVPAALRDVSIVDTTCDLLGFSSAAPLALAPTGYTRMMHPDGERAAALAARDAGLPYTLSTMATTRLEDVAADVGGELWFQLYVWRDRGLTRDLLDRASAAGYRALIVCVDTPVVGLRVRDAHNGFTLPPRLTPGGLLDMAMHPEWCLGLLRGAPITFANFADGVSNRSESVMEFAARQFDASVTWDDLHWIRDRWRGPLLIKGVLAADDAARAVDVGANGIVLSNHGGRQLDQAIPPIDVLPSVRDRVGDHVQLLIDSGVRRGTDIAIALASGADGCLIGRPYLYGLGTAGAEGASAAIDMLVSELRRAMSLMGAADLPALKSGGQTFVRKRLAASNHHYGRTPI